MKKAFALKFFQSTHQKLILKLKNQGFNEN